MKAFNHFLDPGKADDLLVIKELDRLIGRNGRHMFTLFAMLILCISAVSFALGNHRFLNERMNHPFMSWILMPLHNDLDHLEIADHFEYEHPDTMQMMGLQSIDVFFLETDLYLTIPTERGLETGFSRVVAINTEDENIRAIFLDDMVQVLSQRSEYFDDFLDSEQCAILVHRNFLDLMEIEPDDLPDFVLLQKRQNGIASHTIPVKVAGVIDRFPIHVHALMNQSLRSRILEYEEHVSRGRNSSTNFDFTMGIMSHKMPSADKVRTEVRNFAGENDYIDEVHFGDDFLRLEYSSEAYYYFEWPIEVDLSQGAKKKGLTANEIDRIFQQEIRSRHAGEEGYRQYFLSPNPWRCQVSVRAASRADGRPSGMIFRFENLNHLREFSRYMYDEFNAIISMEYVETRDNFRRVVGATFVSIVVLVIFSIFGIFFYLQGILVRHLQNSVKTIGAIKAFGVGNSRLLGIYQKILLRYIGGSVVAAYIFVLLVTLFLPGSWFHTTHWVVLLVVVLIFGMSYVLVTRALRAILTRSPGELLKED